MHELIPAPVVATIGRTLKIPQPSDWMTSARSCHCRPGASVAAALAVLVLIFPVDGYAQADLEARGDSLLSSFDNLAALNAYRAALDQSKSYELLFKTGAAALLAGDQSKESKEKLFDEAVSYAKRLAEQYPDSAGSWTLRAATVGKLAQFRGPRDKARVAREVYEFFHAALQRDTTYAYAYVVAGIFEREVSQLGWLKRLAANAVLGGLPPASLDRSKTYLSRAIELSPQLMPAHWEFAKTCIALGQNVEALVHLKHMQTLTPSNSDDARLQRKAAALASDLSAQLEERRGGR